MTAAAEWDAADHWPPPPPEDDRPDAYLQQLDDAREADQLETAVATRVGRLRMDEEARRRLAAEREADVDHDALFLTRDKLDSLPRPEHLIAGTLPRHSFGILRGRDGTLKTFLALDWALSLATGRQWQGRPTQRARVLYIAGEGAYGIASRVTAWEQTWDHQVAPDQFVIRAAALNLHAPGPAFEHLLEHVHAGQYGLVVVDTLRRVSGAADGNSSEMGAVIDNLDKLRRATADGTVLTLTHTAKDDRDTRGFSGIEDDADYVWHAKRDDNQLEVTCTKMKDGPDGHAHRLQAREAHGSLILEAATNHGAPIATESQIKIVETLQEMFRDGVAGGTLRKATELSDSTYYRALQELKSRGVIEDLGKTPTRPIYRLVNTPTAPTGLPTGADPKTPANTGDSQ